MYPFQSQESVKLYFEKIPTPLSFYLTLNPSVKRVKGRYGEVGRGMDISI